MATNSNSNPPDDLFTGGPGLPDWGSIGRKEYLPLRGIGLQKRPAAQTGPTTTTPAKPNNPFQRRLPRVKPTGSSGFTPELEEKIADALQLQTPQLQEYWRDLHPVVQAAAPGQPNFQMRISYNYTNRRIMSGPQIAIRPKYVASGYLPATLSWCLAYCWLQSTPEQERIEYVSQIATSLLGWEKRAFERYFHTRCPLDRNHLTALSVCRMATLTIIRPDKPGHWALIQNKSPIVGHLDVETAQLTVRMPAHYRQILHKLSTVEVEAANLHVGLIRRFFDLRLPEVVPVA